MSWFPNWTIVSIESVGWKKYKSRSCTAGLRGAHNGDGGGILVVLIKLRRKPKGTADLKFVAGATLGTSAINTPKCHCRKKNFFMVADRYQQYPTSSSSSYWSVVILALQNIRSSQRPSEIDRRYGLFAWDLMAMVSTRFWCTWCNVPACTAAAFINSIFNVINGTIEKCRQQISGPGHEQHFHLKMMARWGRRRVPRAIHPVANWDTLFMRVSLPPIRSKLSGSTFASFTVHHGQTSVHVDVVYG